MKVRALAVLAVEILMGAAFAVSAHAQTNNGSFENNNISTNAPPGFGAYLYAGAVVADNWVFSGGAGVSANNTGWYGTAQDGSYFAFLQNANYGGTSAISQSFSGLAGQYSISFYLAERTQGCYPCDYGAQTINVTFDGQLLSPSPLQPPADGNWSKYSFGATAFNSGTQTLTFNGGPYQGVDSTVFLDHVSVTAAVPEPEAYAMLLAGLGLLGFMSRRRKQKAA